MRCALWCSSGVSLVVPAAEDIDRHAAGTMAIVRDWFKNYKTPDGKPPNKFALNDALLSSTYALQVIEETHHAWARLAVTRQITPTNGLWIM